MSKKIFEVTKKFSVQQCDADGFDIENEYFAIEKGSLWVLDEIPYRIADGEIRLLNDDDNDDLTWIEIPKELFDNNFIFKEEINEN